jgi:hypothetical protein
MIEGIKTVWNWLASTGFGAVAIALITYYLNSRAKSRELKLSSYYKDRIEAVKTLYGLIVELNYANTSLFKSDTRDWGHSTYKSALNRWLLSFNEVNKYYNKNRILLLERSDLSNKVRKNLSLLLPLRQAIYKEHNMLNDIEEQWSGDLQSYYEYAEREEQEINEHLKSLKGDSDITYIIDSFDVIRTDLEDYFRTLVS